MPAITALTRLTALTRTLQPRRLPKLATLFASGERGGYYPLTSLYQDSTGLTAATAADDVVGLGFDAKSGAVEVRRNLLDWSEDASGWDVFQATVDGNVITGTGQYSGIRQNLPLLAGNSIAGFFSVIADSSVDTRALVLNGLGKIEYRLSDCAIVNNTTGLDVLFECHGSDAYTVSFSGVLISDLIRVEVWVGRFNGDDQSGNTITLVRAQITKGLDQLPYQKIQSGTAGEWTPGNHAVQATTGLKPTLQFTPSGKAYLAADSDDALIADFGTALGSTCSIARKTASGVAWLHNQTVGATYNIAAEGEQTQAVFVIDRTPTATEMRVVERAMP